MNNIEKHQSNVCDLIVLVAILARQELHGWNTHGPVTDRIQHAAVEFEDSRYMIVRDDDSTVLVFTQKEWEAFADGVIKGEFDLNAGICRIDEYKEKVDHGLAQ